jgi:hypothetical protein
MLKKSISRVMGMVSLRAWGFEEDRRSRMKKEEIEYRKEGGRYYLL